MQSAELVLKEGSAKRMVPLFLLALPFLSSLTTVRGFDFFYFVVDWPGSYCDSKSCCYPTSGKPAADFGIHGLWPNYNNGSYPSNCDPNNVFEASQISNLISSMNLYWPSLACPSGNSHLFWAHEWDKHGTCAESVLDQHDYFKAALNLKGQANILQMLESSGIEPNNSSYSLSTIEDAIQGRIGYKPGIQCSTDESGNSLLDQVYLCADSSGSNFMQCPVFPPVSCSSQITFPSF